MSAAVCSIEGCSQPPHARGWCSTHYSRWRVHGSTDKPSSPSAEERFWSRVAIAGPDECWEWLGSKNSQGYGVISFRRNTRYGSRPTIRVAYESGLGPIPEGLELDHLCRNRGCVNPAHLDPVTHAENMRRSIPYRRLREKQAS